VWGGHSIGKSRVFRLFAEVVGEPARVDFDGKLGIGPTDGGSNFDLRILFARHYGREFGETRLKCSAVRLFFKGEPHIDEKANKPTRGKSEIC